MPTTIQIKRSTVSGVTPSSLKPGELGINVADKTLYFGNASQVPTILAQSVFVQNAGTAPTSPKTGSFWFQLDTNKLKVYASGAWKDAMPLDSTETELRAYIDTEIDALRMEFQATWPDGSILYTEKTGNPSGWMGFGSWSRIAQGRFIAGEGTGTDYNNKQETAVIGNNAGVYEYILTNANLPASLVRLGGSSGTTDAMVLGTGGAGALATPTPVETLPPSYGLYVWKRTA